MAHYIGGFSFYKCHKLYFQISLGPKSQIPEMHTSPYFCQFDLVTVSCVSSDYNHLCFVDFFNLLKPDFLFLVFLLINKCGHRK